jgi:hypothetical protein
MATPPRRAPFGRLSSLLRSRANKRGVEDTAIMQSHPPSGTPPAEETDIAPKRTPSLRLFWRGFRKTQRRDSQQIVPIASPATAEKCSGKTTLHSEPREPAEDLKSDEGMCALPAAFDKNTKTYF